MPVVSTAKPGFGHITPDSRTGSSNLFLPASLNRSTNPSVSTAPIDPQPPAGVHGGAIQRAFPFRFDAGLLDRTDRFSRSAELLKTAVFGTRIAHHIHVPPRRIGAVQRVIHGNRFGRVKLSATTTGYSSAATSFADLVFRFPVLHAPPPKRL